MSVQKVLDGDSDGDDEFQLRNRTNVLLVEDHSAALGQQICLVNIRDLVRVGIQMERNLEGCETNEKSRFRLRPEPASYKQIGGLRIGIALDADCLLLI